MKATRLNNKEFETTDDAGEHKHLVTAISCDCPDYRFRQAKIGGSCKHMNFIKPLLSNGTQSKLTDTDNAILQFIKDRGIVKHDEIEKQFSNAYDKIQELIRIGEIIYIRETDSYKLM